jgi:hypothetical protein
MSNYNSSEQGQLPKEKKRAPLGKWLLLKLRSLNIFPAGKDRNIRLLLTTVSKYKDYRQTLTGGQSLEECPPQAHDKLAGKVDSSNGVWSIKIFLN